MPQRLPHMRVMLAGAQQLVRRLLCDAHDHTGGGAYTAAALIHDPEADCESLEVARWQVQGWLVMVQQDAAGWHVGSSRMCKHEGMDIISVYSVVLAHTCTGHCDTS